MKPAELTLFEMEQTAGGRSLDPFYTEIPASVQVEIRVDAAAYKARGCDVSIAVAALAYGTYSIYPHPPVIVIIESVYAQG